MKCSAGIDLGSTTTKAVLLDGGGRIIGQGITNSRSDYAVACAVALEEARLSAALSRLAATSGDAEALRARTRLALYRRQLGALRSEIERFLDGADAAHQSLQPAADRVLDEMEAEAGKLFESSSGRRSDFFRDIAGGRFLEKAERLAQEGVPFERLVGLYDRAVLAVETRVDSYDPVSLLREAGGDTEALDALERDPIDPVAVAGTGYGRQTLPFPESAVRSEILCHGRGAHWWFPQTRTVLDIGGQDTKAIQVDGHGVVTGFQMNDRCAAGCGRYLGYIADELSLGLHELGPLALQARRSVRVNSTCTVFAGAELRERLALGERREDILSGLHRAIMLRAMSLLSRAGGVKNELTFTGGVCKNPAATQILHELVKENYGDGITINIHPDSIYMGALGAALFALDDWRAGRGQRAAFVTGTSGAEASAALTPSTHQRVEHAPAKAGPAAVKPRERPDALYTAGIDVGASAVKVAIAADDEIVATSLQRIRRRSVPDVARSAFEEACERAGITPERVAYIASTGDGDAVPFRTGHFYSMTAHARGALHLVPDARGALDLGALHARAIKMDVRGRVLGHRMTSQCASGTGQFLENVARYLGVPLEDVGALSLEAAAPESVSSICAVLSETDVINMVSRGISTADILQGIHLSIATRLGKLVSSARIEGPIALTGGLAQDAGLVATIAKDVSGGAKPVEVRAAPDAALAGAIGASLLAALRHRQLASRTAA